MPAQDASDWEQRRVAMVDLIARAGVRDSATLAAMLRVPRHEFVPVEDRELAYGDFPLPIGYGQTISQPYIVAFMTEQLHPRPEMKVLEIGTGSGYQAAVLGEIGCMVYTIEIVESLARRAAAVLARLGYDDVHVRFGDGYQGWPDAAPFDAVIVTAAADEIPPLLLDQLAAGGRLIMPVGPQDGVQYLTVVDKDRAGQLTPRVLLPVRFVPLIEGKGGRR
ncbi:MAG: protein-L-isoaspartate(D-aspartate) O-methyltransferase [Gemmatimonadota bacterium]|nr:protein-L-isoaspartate(D-aspartate) O-methyltransferase [Gemmatimonadota bacterium]